MGIVLMVLGVYLGLSIYTEGVDGFLGRWLGSEKATPDAAALEADESYAQPSSEPQAAGQAAPSAITSRVRERVSSAMEEGTHRYSGE